MIVDLAVQSEQVEGVEDDVPPEAYKRGSCSLVPAPVNLWKQARPGWRRSFARPCLFLFFGGIFWG
ncbi:MAG: hypothetical protein WCD75_17780, partial [Rhodoplanes sp.]